MPKTLYLIALLLTLPAHAASTGDLAADKGTLWLDRPAVPSDARRHADMFPAHPLLLNTNADLVANVHPRTTYGREEMVTPHRLPIPDSPLFRDPR